MILTPSLDSAIKLASRLHRTQTRKGAEATPYISHLIAVAILVSSVTDDEEIIVAGLMHDCLEDVPDYSYEDLVRDCGERVAQIVKHVTEPLDANKEEGDQLPWMTRKEAYLETLKQGGVESAIVSCADKIHNTESFLLDSKKGGESFALAFGSSSENRLMFHEKVLVLIQEKLGDAHPLVVRLTACTEAFRKMVYTTRN